MRYVVYGAGAVGGVIGGHLHLAGLRHHPRRARRAPRRHPQRRAAARHGRRPRSDSTIPAAETAAEVDWTDDTVVLLTVKSHQTASALDDLAAHAPAGTVVVSAQNGVANERAVLRRFARTYADHA